MASVAGYRCGAEIVMQGSVTCVMQEVKVDCHSSSSQSQIVWSFSIWPGILEKVTDDGGVSLNKAIANKLLKKKLNNFIFPPASISLFQEHWNPWSPKGNRYSLEAVREEKGRQREWFLFIPLKIRILKFSSHSKIKEENIRRAPWQYFYQWDSHDSKEQES